jgi:hypothetical protein
MADEPVGVVVIVFDRSLNEIANCNPGCFSLNSDKEKLTVEAAIAAYAAAHPMHIKISLVGGKSVGRQLG